MYRSFESIYLLALADSIIGPSEDADGEDAANTSEAKVDEEYKKPMTRLSKRNVA